WSYGQATQPVRARSLPGKLKGAIVKKSVLDSRICQPTPRVIGLPKGRSPSEEGLLLSLDRLAPDQVPLRHTCGRYFWSRSPPVPFRAGPLTAPEGTAWSPQIQITSPFAFAFGRRMSVLPVTFVLACLPYVIVMAPLVTSTWFTYLPLICAALPMPAALLSAAQRPVFA